MKTLHPLKRDIESARFSIVTLVLGREKRGACQGFSKITNPKKKMISASFSLQGPWLNVQGSPTQYFQMQTLFTTLY
jgi:hypothetical protein